MLRMVVCDIEEEAARLMAAAQYSAASNVLQRGMDLGHLTSRANLAWLLLWGREGVATDRQRAFQLVVEGCELGCSDCMGVAALCYIGGIGSVLTFGVCECNMEQALELSLQSCEHGSRYGQLARGLLHYYQHNVDYDQAAAYFSLAAAQNLDYAYRWLGVFYENGMGVPHDEVKARRSFRQAANQGLQEGMCVALALALIHSVCIVSALFTDLDAGCF